MISVFFLEKLNYEYPQQENLFMLSRSETAPIHTEHYSTDKNVDTELSEKHCQLTESTESSREVFAEHSKQGSIPGMIFDPFDSKYVCNSQFEPELLNVTVSQGGKDAEKWDFTSMDRISLATCVFETSEDSFENLDEERTHGGALPLSTQESLTKIDIEGTTLGSSISDMDHLRQIRKSHQHSQVVCSDGDTISTDERENNPAYNHMFTDGCPSHQTMRVRHTSTDDRNASMSEAEFEGSSDHETVSASSANKAPTHAVTNHFEIHAWDVSAGTRVSLSHLPTAGWTKKNSCRRDLDSSIDYGYESLSYLDLSYYPRMHSDDHTVINGVTAQ